MTNQVSQSGWLLSRRGRGSPAHVSGVGTHRVSISRCGPQGAARTPIKNGGTPADAGGSNGFTKPVRRPLSNHLFGGRID
eukprot:COSAG01_NODE_1888_length_8979_cov_78.343806_15_plen_80_part_00